MSNTTQYKPKSVGRHRSTVSRQESRSVQRIVGVIASLSLAMASFVALSTPTNASGSVWVVNPTGGVTSSDGLKLEFENGSFRATRNNQSQTYEPDDGDGDLDEETYNGVLLAISSDTTRTVFKTPRYDNVGGATPLIPIGSPETSTLSVLRVFYADLNSNGSFNANDDVRLTLAYDYTLGDQHFSASYTVERPSGSSMSIQLYHSIDMYLDGSDSGPSTSSTSLSQIFPGRYVVQQGSDTVGGFAQKNADVFTSYWAGYYNDIGDLVDDHDPLPNTVDDDPTTDVGVGIHFDLGTATASVSRSSFIIFTSLASVSLPGSEPVSSSPSSPSSPAPQKQHVSTPNKTPAPGETVAMFGAFFGGITEVFVGGVKVEIISTSDNRVNIRMPLGLTGALDVELKSPLGSLLLPKHFTIGTLPAAGTRQATIIVGGFDHNSRKLTPRMQARIDRWLERNSDLLTLTCTGFTSLPRRTTDVQLSTNRGTTACNFAKSQRPELTTSVSQGVEDPRPGSNVRRVKLVLTP